MTIIIFVIAYIQNIFMKGTAIVLSSDYSTQYRVVAPVHLSDVQCSGTESKLIDCLHTLGGSDFAASLECEYYSSGKYFSMQNKMYF